MHDPGHFVELGYESVIMDAGEVVIEDKIFPGLRNHGHVAAYYDASSGLKIRNPAFTACQLSRGPAFRSATV